MKLFLFGLAIFVATMAANLTARSISCFGFGHWC